jgi:erythromycin esterase-like protein
MQAVIDFLSKRDQKAAQLALKRYACFDHLKFDPTDYGFLTTYGLKALCNKEVLEQLMALQEHASKYLQEDGIAAEDEFFYACQNARVVKNAENYYRSMFEGHIDSWNARDTHMFETLNYLIEYLDKRYGKPSKIIIWAHNSHIGDASSTEMGDRGEINIGQLVKEQYGEQAYSIGFSTYAGTVTAASEWDGNAENKTLNPGLEGSYEALFHQLQYKDFILHLGNHTALYRHLAVPRLQRAVGVIYRADTELESHYFLTRLNSQFNSIFHFDVTTAVTPLD